MAFELTDGTGSGYKAKVNTSNNLLVLANSRSLIHYTSHELGLFYSVFGVISSITASKNNILYIKNLSSEYDLVISEFFYQTIGLTGGTAVPSTTTYVSVHTSPEYTSGGVSVTPLNNNLRSSNLADGTFFIQSPVFSSDGSELKRIYIESNGKYVRENVDSTIILGQNDDLSISLTTDHTSGLVMAGINFSHISLEH